MLPWAPRASALVRKCLHQCPAGFWSRLGLACISLSIKEVLHVAVLQTSTLNFLSNTVDLGLSSLGNKGNGMWKPSFSLYLDDRILPLPKSSLVKFSRVCFAACSLVRWSGWSSRISSSAAVGSVRIVPLMHTHSRCWTLLRDWLTVARVLLEI